MNAKIGSRLIETLTSALYSDPIVLFREYVQNSTDNYLLNKDNIHDFKVEIKVDIKQKTISIFDNGSGIPYEKFIDKMITIGDSDKRQYEDLVGFKGIGRLSGMPFCEELVFRNKCMGSKKVQIYTWSNENYLKLLESKSNTDLYECMKTISKPSEEPEIRTEEEHFFEVQLRNYKDDLGSMMCGKKDKLNDKFIKDLSNILPLPYLDSFSKKTIIEEKYNDFFGCPLSKYEFPIFLNGEKLFKSYTDNDIKSDIYFVEFQFNEELKPKNKKFGLMWFSCDYVFKAYRGDFGINVRSKNILLNDKQVFADECYRSINRTTTHGQLIAGLKGIKGELLILSKDLSDNSKRDWFRYDSYALFLRKIIVEFMKNLHEYRYKASEYFNNQTQQLNAKTELINSFEKFVSIKTEQLSGFIEKFDFGRPMDLSGEDKDIIACLDDFDDYSNEYKEAYIDIMNSIYDFLSQKNIKNGKDIFFKLKAKIIDDLKSSK